MAQAYELWPQTALRSGLEADGDGLKKSPDAAERPEADLSRLGLLLCFASAVLTLIGIGSALERIFS